ncbi:phospho-N-acetylmuramoyl-pentapeptide-transferase [Lutimonas zeaxanthinifaciens]|uniref:phospho-N-acetylmuramoyl-pentapeptide- transferase n=1 Tax=Lutimonas zeaxanthinifaciens TaxID=3060215 RepID=UPI00265C9366|nr:phospho-N-acetylmuramoyl-pentapeptide-transferase [Lutimonas sp. YSD2104]WKK65392.1 phospho-N-acetylmuramoyl-pentapeptide-transferase [Lutimonas sp. YSD2104]
MLYYLFEFLDENTSLPGTGLFQYISFRSALAFAFSLLISTIYGRKIIDKLRRLQVGESIRDLGLEGQVQKQGTPTMGGVIIILATLIPVFLFAKLDNIYIIILIVTTVWMGIIGFIDDYIKVFKKNKEGLKGRFKIVGQITLGAFVGLMLYFNPDVVVKEKLRHGEVVISQELTISSNRFGEAEKSTKTTIPFVKNNEFDYANLLTWMGDWSKDYVWLFFVVIVIFIITAVSNGANLTDGIDGLAAGSSAIIVLALAIFAWVSGNIIFADYLNVMYIPNSGEITIFVSAFVGGLVGFLWYNTYPAQVFMGDTGSLTIGAVIAVIALSVRKEFLIPILAGIFLAENLSVVFQVSYFKYTRKKTGVGKRIFLMAPLHHHYQKRGYHESKIVTRFWIVGILLAVISILTLKVR